MGHVGTVKNGSLKVHELNLKLKFEKFDNSQLDHVLYGAGEYMDVLEIIDCGKSVTGFTQNFSTFAKIQLCPKIPPCDRWLPDGTSDLSLEFEN